MSKNILLLVRKKRLGNHSFERLYSQLQYEFIKRHSVVNLTLLEARFVNLVILFFNQFKFHRIHFTGGSTWYMLFYFYPEKLLTIHDCYKLRYWIDKPRFLGGMQSWLYKYLYFNLPMHFATKVSCPSEFTIRELANLYPRVNDNKYVHLPNFLILQDNFTISENIDKINSVLLMGSSHNKNIYISLCALSKVQQKLKIYKTGFFTPVELQILGTYNIDFEELGFVSDSDIALYLSKSDVLLFPSYYEGFGLPIIESQYYNTLVITSRISPCREILQTDLFLVNPYDSDDIAEKIETVLSLTDSNKAKLKLINHENSRRYLMDNLFDLYEEFYMN
jgi:glycosyltransferase involved in cell wall biosynthesis